MKEFDQFITPVQFQYMQQLERSVSLRKAIKENRAIPSNAFPHNRDSSLERRIVMGELARGVEKVVSARYTDVVREGFPDAADILVMGGTINKTTGDS